MMANKLYIADSIGEFRYAGEVEAVFTPIQIKSTRSKFEPNFGEMRLTVEGLADTPKIKGENKIKIEYADGEMHVVKCFIMNHKGSSFVMQVLEKPEILNPSGT